MTTTSQASQGDIGLPIVIDLTTWPTLTDATITIDVTKPSGVRVSWPALTAVVGSELQVSHTAGAGDLDESGVYTLRVRFSYGDGRLIRDPNPVKLGVEP